MPKPFPLDEFVGPDVEISRGARRYTDAEIRHNVAISKARKARATKAPRTPMSNNWRKMFEILS